MPVDTRFNMHQKGDVTNFKVCNSWRFRKSEIDRWIKEGEKKRA